MIYDNFIDSLAVISKTGIENSMRSREEKEWVKSGVDCLSAILKQIQLPEQQHQNQPVMGIRIEQIPRIKECARQYDVKRVVLVPYFVNNQIVTFMHVDVTIHS